MNKAIAVLAIMVSANAFAGGGDAPWYNNGQYPIRDAAVAVIDAAVDTVKAVGGAIHDGAKAVGGTIADGAQATVDFAAKGLTECTIKYKKVGGNLLIGGLRFGNSAMTCKNDFSGEQSNSLDSVEIQIGPGLGLFSEEGEIRLAGYGTSAKQVAGILAQARVIAAFGNKGGSAGLAVGAFMGPTGEFPLGATSVFGYSRGTAKGIGAAATVSVEIYLDSAVREGVVAGVNHVVDHITGKQEGQSSPSQQSPAQQSPAQQSPAQQK